MTQAMTITQADRRELREAFARLDAAGWPDADRAEEAREARARERRGSEAPREYLAAFDTYLNGEGA